MVTYGLHANADFLYVINGLRELSSASASWFWPRPRPRPQRFVLGLGLGLENLSSFNITACKIDNHIHTIMHQPALVRATHYCWDNYYNFG